jgi:hypothetical protein
LDILLIVSSIAKATEIMKISIKTGFFLFNVYFIVGYRLELKISPIMLSFAIKETATQF